VIRVLAPGLFTTVQDLGRHGYGPMGVSPAGAADPIALRLGNRLVGNGPSAAALEMTLAGATLEFQRGAVVALTGAEFDASIGFWRAHEIAPGGTVRIGRTLSDARCYLCVRGGVEVESWLGSASTHVLSGLGGFHGRALKSGDLLAIGVAALDSPRNRVRRGALEKFAHRKVLRVTWGPRIGLFTDTARTLFLDSRYLVTEEASRMGLRLDGPPIDAAAAGHMITEGVALGAIQAPPGGRPIILFVDQQTTGGYPVIANVISADLPSVGQLRPRDEIAFELVSLETARLLAVEQERLLAREDILFC
jgi:antagonist of KipI